MTLFYEEIVTVGDMMFDLNRGYGRVIQIFADSMEVEFEGKKVGYSFAGFQKGKTNRTLFWSQPYVIAPSKDAEHWAITREKFDAILAILKTKY